MHKEVNEADQTWRENRIESEFALLQYDQPFEDRVSEDRQQSA
jgi:hypothetical protein